MPVVKRYPNRKLYDTQAKCYVTLDGIAELIRAGEDVQVIDHASGEDLTALTLTQIIFEQEKKHSGLLPLSTLTGLIRSSGDRLTSIQRNLFSSTFWHQIDDEIRARIHALVKIDELSEEEGSSLLEKLLLPQIRSRGSSGPDQLSSEIDSQDLEAYLIKRQVPTQDDLHQLYAQLEALSEKLENVSKTQDD